MRSEIRWQKAVDGERRWTRRLRRRLARTAEAVAGRPVGRPLPWERRAARSRQARPEEAQEPSWGPAMEDVWACRRAVLAVVVDGHLDADRGVDLPEQCRRHAAPRYSAPPARARKAHSVGQHAAP